MSWTQRFKNAVEPARAASSFRLALSALFHKLRISWLLIIGLGLLTAWPRLTALNQYLIVDEEDRWRWAQDFVLALSRGDLAGTLVGDGYPGIVPVWAESIWVTIEAIRRSWVEGQWIGEVGLAFLFHEWNRTAYLMQQRLPIILLNTILALAIVWAVWRLFGKRVALVSGLLIALDPFYLSDSRVNRAEAVITGLMTLSVLSLIFYDRQRRFRYAIISGILGGLSFLTKIQALAMLPALGLAGLLIGLGGWRRQGLAVRGQGSGVRSQELGIRNQVIPQVRLLVWLGLGWAVAAGLTWLILWPAMWVRPLETLSLVYDYTTRKVGEEGINLFFLGQTYQDSDPGLLFYPVVFFMRITPLALLGLLAAAISPLLMTKAARQTLPGNPFAAGGSAILAVYVLGYALAMTIGSHKQDRYLMPIFLALDILAALGLVFIWTWLKFKISSLTSHIPHPTSHILTPPFEYLLLAALIIIQLATVLPHHPYYYSYFNPLFGGGQTAVRTLRIGWGEGMDQVGAYLAAKPDSQGLVVTSRFTDNMLGFDGRLISLAPNGRWTQADYVVLYIQQVQRGQDPTPGFIQYFQAQQPEKVITIGGIDYAWIYPMPFTVAADPQVSLLPGQAALLGYRWEMQETNAASTSDGDKVASPQVQLRLLWENQGLAAERQIVSRLVGHNAKTDWTACLPEPAFSPQAQTPGAYVESLCRPEFANLPPGIYTVDFGLAAAGRRIESFLFPEAWQAVRITGAGQVVDTNRIERLDALAAETVPPEGQWLDRVYDGRIRLAAYRLDPPQPVTGADVELTLYWQRVDEVLASVQQATQLAESRDISLGRVDSVLPAQEWLDGEVVASHYQFELPQDLDGPVAARIEVSLKDQLEVFLWPTTLSGETRGPVIGRFTVAPNRWPTLVDARPLEAAWYAETPPSSAPNSGRENQETATLATDLAQISLRGYRATTEPVRPGESLEISLFWQTDRPIAENYMVFVHVVDEAGQLKAQNDSLPRAGAYPTDGWQPGHLVEDIHRVDLPADLPGGTYQLVVGLYEPQNGRRLPLSAGGDQFIVGSVEIQ